MAQEIIESTLNPRSYRISEVSFIKDRYQSYLYIKHGARPIDMYVSTDDDLVMVFLKKDTKLLYEKYRKYELN